MHFNPLSMHFSIIISCLLQSPENWLQIVIKTFAFHCTFFPVHYHCHSLVCADCKLLLHVLQMLTQELNTHRPKACLTSQSLFSTSIKFQRNENNLHPIRLLCSGGYLNICHFSLLHLTAMISFRMSSPLRRIVHKSTQIQIHQAYSKSG